MYVQFAALLDCSKLPAAALPPVEVATCCQLLPAPAGVGELLAAASEAVWRPLLTSTQFSSSAPLTSIGAASPDVDVVVAATEKLLHIQWCCEISDYFVPNIVSDRYFFLFQEKHGSSDGIVM